ncbi:MAG: hypothetical protein ACSLEM_04635 [Candidatus Malihini olakiniferum]
MCNTTILYGHWFRRTGLWRKRITDGVLMACQPNRVTIANIRPSVKQR